MTNPNAFGILFRRDLKNLFTNPALIMYNTVFPLLMAAVLGYLTKDGYGGMGVTSYDFYGVTLLLFSASSVAMTSANSFMEQRIKASNLRVLFAPVAPSSVYISKITATFVFTTACFAAVAGALRLGFNVELGGGRFPYVVAILLLLSLFSSALGVMFCCLLRSEEMANKVLSPVIQIMALAGGLFFPVDGLSPAVERLSWFSPVKWVAEAAFRIIYDHDIGMVGPVLLVLALGAAGAVAGCRLTFRTEDYV